MRNIFSPKIIAEREIVFLVGSSLFPANYLMDSSLQNLSRRFQLPVGIQHFKIEICSLPPNADRSRMSKTASFKDHFQLPNSIFIKSICFNLSRTETTFSSQKRAIKFETLGFIPCFSNMIDRKREIC